MKQDTIVKALFTLDDEQSFEGYHNPSINWNGWNCPYFTKQVMEQLIASETFQGWAAKWEGDNVVITLTDESDAGCGDETTLTPEVIRVGVEDITVYDFSPMGWVWYVQEAPFKAVIASLESVIEDLQDEYHLFEKIGERAGMNQCSNAIDKIKDAINGLDLITIKHV